MTASYFKHSLQFKRPSGTSRGVLNEKDSWFIILNDGDSIGIGECGLLKGLSIDAVPEYESTLKSLCDKINQGRKPSPAGFVDFPSIRFGLEMAYRSLSAERPFLLFPSEFTLGEKAVITNGLIWMGDEDFMQQQIATKIEAGFRCIKMKIGAMDFDKELNLLRSIRRNFGPEQIELRVDANGAFELKEATDKLKRLSEFELHSIEQPIAAGQWDAMAKLCESTQLPIALDEELIGIHDLQQKKALIKSIMPQFIILKPSLLGGFIASDEWIELAEDYGLGWWITSALESNLGLNAISQYTFTKNSTLPQGLGTGGLYTNNIRSPLKMTGEQLWYSPEGSWDMKFFM